VEEKGLKLSGTLLGPVSVAILESKDGYLVLPAGSPIPGSEAIVKGIEEGRVTLALKEERMDLTLSGGGEWQVFQSRWTGPRRGLRPFGHGRELPR
jgi:hypothetical protein